MIWEKPFSIIKKGNKYVKSDIGKKFIHGFWGTYVAPEESVSKDLGHLIATHSKDSPLHPQLLEGIILHYADFAHGDRYSTFPERHGNVLMYERLKVG